MRRHARTLTTVIATLVALCVSPATSFAQESAGSAEHETATTASGENGAHEGESEGAEHGEHEHHLDPVNAFQFGHTDSHGKPQPPLLATVINFSLLVLILFYAVRKAINPALNDRRAAIEAEIGEAQRLRAEAEALHREYTERLDRMQDELAEMRAEFQRAGESEYQRIIAEANERAERMRREGEFTIAQELKQVRDDLLREAVETAAESAEKAVRGQIGPQDHAKLADQFLASLDRNPGASA
jgi:F-type H+-transporting ATPase subunit b